MCYRRACLCEGASYLGQELNGRIESNQADEGVLVHSREDPTFCFDCLSVDSCCNHTRICKINDATSRIKSMMQEALILLKQKERDQLDKIEFLMNR